MPKVTILPDGKTVEVAPGTTLLEASDQAAAMHGSACGGHGACSSCHVFVRSGGATMEEASEHELDQLESAFGATVESRLGCQARVGKGDVTFEISEESLQTWLDEHPERRRSFETEGLPVDVSPELRQRLTRLLRAKA